MKIEFDDKARENVLAATRLLPDDGDGGPDDAARWGIIDDEGRDVLTLLHATRIKADYWADHVELVEAAEVTQLVLVRKRPGGERAQGEEENKELFFGQFLGLLLSFSPCELSLRGISG